MKLCVTRHFSPEETPKVYFPSYLESKISVSEVHILSSFPASFQRFRSNLERILPDNHAKKSASGNVYFSFH